MIDLRIKERKMDRSDLWKEILLFAAMVSLESANVGVNVIYKAATLNGMSYYVFIFYSYAIGTLVLLPFALFLCRTSTLLPSIKFPLISRICFLGLIGCFARIFSYKGIAYSSPTLASAMSNLTPAFTFTLAVIFRMEKLILRNASTQAKVIGTIISISGALVVVLYKGPTILSSSPTQPLSLLQWPLVSLQSNWVLGAFFLAVEYILFSFFYIIQTDVLKMYPSKLEVVFFCNLSATIIAAPICFMGEADLSAWRPSSETALIAIIYSGLSGLSLASVVHAWGLHMKGPLYIASFRPLSIAISAVMGFIFLGDALYLGSVIGGVIICTGFYGVLWGKANEEDSSFVAVESKSKTPLLQSLKVEDL